MLNKVQAKQRDSQSQTHKLNYITPSKDKDKEKENIFDSNRGRREREPSHTRNNLFGRILEMSLGDTEVRDKKAATLTVMKNLSEDLRKAFHHYFTSIFYRALPGSMLYYPTQKVVACDLNLLHYHLSKHEKPLPLLSMVTPSEKPLTDSSATATPAPTAAVAAVTSSSASASSTENGLNLPESLKHPGNADSEGEAWQTGDNKGAPSAFGRGQMQRLFSLKEGTDSNKDLATRSIERDRYTGTTDAVADVPVSVDKGTLPFQGTLDLENAFSHLIVSSPAFFDLVKRHGPVLQHFRF